MPSLSAQIRQHGPYRVKGDILMRNWMMPLALAGLPVLGVQAQPALFDDEVLTIKEAIVVESGQTRYYENVQMRIENNGDFKVLDAVEKPLATITEKSVDILESNPVQAILQVKGYKPTPCYELHQAVTREGDTFHVVISLNVLQTLVACVQVIDPFELSIPLDVSTLPPGQYHVNLNGESLSFQTN